MAIQSVLEKIERTAVYPKSYNARDYFNLPEGSPFQLIEGELIMSPSPLTEHQIISKNLELIIYSYLKKNNIGLALNAPIDVYLDNKNAFQPDIIFISDGNKDIIKKHGIDGSPDLVIEILSPSNAYYDLKDKKYIYERSGVKEYVIVDPRIKSVEIFRIAGLLTDEFQEGFSGKTDKAKKIPLKNKFRETVSAKEENDDSIFIKTLGLEISLKEIFEGV